MTRHDPTTHRPLCPFCGGSNVQEIYPEDDARHRHVCMDPDCPKITSNLRRKAAGLPVLYPDLEKKVT